LNGATDGVYREKVEMQISALREETERLRLQARDAHMAGDRLYWPIFNLDQKNPNAPEEDENQDPDVLLEKYRKLLGEIEETENQLKSELGAALAHHLVGDGA
jgi:type I restriction enzyme M protein